MSGLWRDWGSAQAGILSEVPLWGRIFGHSDVSLLRGTSEREPTYSSVHVYPGQRPEARGHAWEPWNSEVVSPRGSRVLSVCHLSRETGH